MLLFAILSLYKKLCIRQQLKEKPKEVIRVSVSEAAKLFGVNAQTIRRRAITAKEVIL